VRAPVDWVPEVALAPDHAPEAEQAVAFVEDQVSIELPPLATEVGFAAIDTTTLLAAAGPAGDATLDSPAPPQAENVRVSTRTSSKVLVRNMGILIP
jgi:hypothetical protein